MDLLVGNRIVSSQEVSLPIVSAAISHLWQNLSEEWKASLLQSWTQGPSGAPGSAAGASQNSAGAEDSMKDSGIDSQGPSYSLLSTPEEVSGPCGWGGAEGYVGTTLLPQAWRYRGPARGHCARLRRCLDSGPHSRCLIFST